MSSEEFLKKIQKLTDKYGWAVHPVYEKDDKHIAGLIMGTQEMLDHLFDILEEFESMDVSMVKDHVSKKYFN